MRQIFCDWHMPSFLPELKFDYDDYFENIKKTSAKTLICVAKSAHGNCLFPSKVGFTNKAMHGDIFGEVCKRSKEAGLEFIAYYNMVLNNELANVHPEWRQVDKNRKPLKLYRYECFCMSNDRYKEFVCKNMEEIARNYEIDGFFLDILYFHDQGCYCKSCCKKFKKMFAYSLSPEEFKTTRQWQDFYDFQNKIKTDFMLTVKKRCDNIRPNLVWAWNGSASFYRSCWELDNNASFLTAEAHPPGYLKCEYYSRSAQGFEKPFFLTMPEGQGSWGDWTLSTSGTFKGMSAICLSLGGAVTVSQVPYPCGTYGGRVPVPVWQTTADVLDWVVKREKFCSNKKTVPVVGCIHSRENVKIFRALNKAGYKSAMNLEEETFHNELMLTQILSESHIPLDFIHDEFLSKLNEYEAIILPHIPYVSGELAGRLREYVKNGGKLVATYETSLMDKNGNLLNNFSLSELFGVDFIRTSDYSVSYLDRLDEEIARSIPQMPLLIKDKTGGDNPPNHVLYCRVRPSTKILGFITDPVIESDFPKGYHIYHDHSPPGNCTDYPGIVVNRFGKGEVVFLPIPFFKAYMSDKSPFLRQVFQQLLVRQLGISQKLRVQGPVSVKTVLMQDDDGWLLHLIHIQKETDSIYLDMFERNEPVKIKVCPGWDITNVYQCLSREKIPFEKSGRWTGFTVKSVTGHQIIRIEKKTG